MKFEPQGLWNCQRLLAQRQDHALVKFCSPICIATRRPLRAPMPDHVLTWNVMLFRLSSSRCGSLGRHLAFFAAAALSFAAWPGPAAAQRARGELRIEVKDPLGRPAAAEAELVSGSNQAQARFSHPRRRQGSTSPRNFPWRLPPHGRSRRLRRLDRSGRDSQRSSGPRHSHPWRRRRQRAH